VRLKSLEIKGFKSFADKTVLNFDEGITGVIGPNGCGKSNIVDSIRWVIGEHKISNLRSENLESLVFNGSKSRGASGLAEVSLTFDNTKNLLPTEFNTVTVTRKFYKSGESEYRLNDVQCRLKDIHNLFLDTGVSTDSYAIMELGMVDDIIKDKENSRRKMLEQAAGVSIYKTRKKEAKLKLDATEQDLARIEDLLFEIHNQLKMLESQAKKAEKYFEIKKEYKVKSIELAKAALEGFNIQYRDLTEQQQQESDRKIGVDTKITNGGGRYYTPFNVAASTVAGSGIRDEANTYGSRFEDYFRLDFKTTLRANVGKVTHEFFVDIQNITNRQNPFSKVWNSEKNKEATVPQLGLFPNVNYRIVF
jgi:chromosome segregation protein